MAVKPTVGTSKKRGRRKKKWGTLTLGILERMQEEERAKKAKEVLSDDAMLAQLREAVRFREMKKRYRKG